MVLSIDGGFAFLKGGSLCVDEGREGKGVKEWWLRTMINGGTRCTNEWMAMAFMVDGATTRKEMKNGF